MLASWLSEIIYMQCYRSVKAEVSLHACMFGHAYISKALGLRSESQVVHNKSVPKFVDGAI